jgi:hypothetical protein
MTLSFVPTAVQKQSFLNQFKKGKLPPLVEDSQVLQGLFRCLGGGIPRGCVGIALAFCLCVFRLHHSRGMFHGMFVCAGGALAGCYEPTAQVKLYPVFIQSLSLSDTHFV